MRRRAFIAVIAGGGATWCTRTASAWTQKLYRLVILSYSSPASELTEKSDFSMYRAFFAELRRLGFEEGRNFLIDRFSAVGDLASLPGLARKVLLLNYWSKADLSGHPAATEQSGDILNRYSPKILIHD